MNMRYEYEYEYEYEYGYSYEYEYEIDFVTFGSLLRKTVRFMDTLQSSFASTICAHISMRKISFGVEMIRKS